MNKFLYEFGCVAACFLIGSSPALAIVLLAYLAS